MDAETKKWIGFEPIKFGEPDMPSVNVILPSALASAPLPFELHFAHLSQEEQATAKKLIHCLNAPIDMPMALQVVETAAKLIDDYGLTLETPTAVFENLNARMTTLVQAIRAMPVGADELDRPLMRRLTNHSAWALAIELSREERSRAESLAFSIEIALSLATEKRFPNGYARNLRMSLQREPDDLQRTDPAWLPHFRRISRTAAALFENGGSIPGTPELDVNTQTRHELLRTARFETVKHRQGVGEPRSVHPLALREASMHVANECAAGNQTALVRALSICTGVSYATTRRLPLSEGPGDWTIAVDVQTGTIKTCLDDVFEGAAKATDSAGTRPASRVVVKPLPKFLHDALKAVEPLGRATSVAELLPVSDVTTSSLTIGDRRTAIPMTITRMLKSRARLCCESGQDRVASACVLNDYSVIPSSKVYYCLLDRQDLWKASSTFYELLGWGAETVGFVPGLPFGSRIVPEDSSIKEWLAWMRQDVIAAAPSKRYCANSLFEHHNRFAKLCASLAAFGLALREQKEYRLRATEFDGIARTININDKTVGWFPRALPVPVAEFLRHQAKLWRFHCQALDRRLEKLGFDDVSSLRLTLRSILLRADAPAFFLVDQHGKPKPLGSAALRAWWPEAYRFSPDWGRHYWEPKLRQLGVPSSAIDVLLRHHVAGLEQWHGATAVAAVDRFQLISSAQDLVMGQLGFAPIAGLSSKGECK